MFPLMATPKRNLTPKRLAARERSRRAYELRVAGASFDRIADTLDFADESGARKAVAAFVERLERETVDQARYLELDRLDRMLIAITEQIRKGHLGAIDRALKIMERRSKLLGLDAPTKTDVTSGGQPISVTFNQVPARDEPPG
jgi:hypothetical protein